MEQIQDKGLDLQTYDSVAPDVGGDILLELLIQLSLERRQSVGLHRLLAQLREMNVVRQAENLTRELCVVLQGQAVHKQAAQCADHLTCHVAQPVLHNV